jgi:hypothetical protein
MDLFAFLKNNLDRRVVTGLLVVLLLLTAVSSGIAPDISPKINADNITISSPINSPEFLVFPPQPRLDYSLYQSKSAIDYIYNKKIPVNDTLAVYQNYASRNSLPRLLGPAPVLPNSLHKDIKFFYLFADIPPPSSNI